MENFGDKGDLSGGIRVSEQSKIYDGESNRGDVVSGTERKSVESGNSITNDKHDVSNNRVAEKVSRNDRWESWGVMNMVGRVLGGKLYMDDEVEDLNDYENRGRGNRDVDVNTWQDAVTEPKSENGIDIKGMDIDFDSAKLDSSSPVEVNSLNGREVVESEEINDIKADVMKLEGEGETEEVNDVKVDTNEIAPHVPMEIEEANDLKADSLTLKSCEEETEKEREYNASDLVWGKVKSHPWWPGQIFAASSASDKAKKHFKKESYLVAYFGDESFAWNEGSKLLPFQKHFSEMVKQNNSDGFLYGVNCALDESARRVEFGLSCPCLAKEVRDEIKYQIVENSGIREESSIRCGGDNVSSVDTFVAGDALQFVESLAKCPQFQHDKLQYTITKAQLLAYNRWKGYDQLPEFEEHTGLYDDDILMGEGNNASCRKRKLMATNGSSRKCKQVKEKSISVLMSSDSSSLHKNNEKFATNKRRKVDAKLASNGGGNSQIAKTTPTKIPTPEMLLSKLSLAAKKPTQSHNGLNPVVGFLREFRNSFCLDKSSEEVDSSLHKSEQPSQTADISGFGGIEDSYWTDRIIQNYSKDQSLFESQKPDDVSVPKLNDNKESNEAADLASDSYQPTSLIFKFANLDSVPPIKNLNEIFSRYGALDESKTKILSKTKRVTLTFKKPENAETAFSSSGKYSIFGPSLLSYRLRYASDKTAKKKKKKGKQSKEGSSQKVDGV